jgi:NADPH2:quinone reductase
MKAILLRRLGDSSALEYADVPTPQPKANEVLVKAHTIGVGMPEVLARKGSYEWTPTLPFILGIEMSGTVVERGRDVKSPAIGQAVFVSARDLPIRAGCYAEYIAVPAETVHILPEGCSLEASACLSNYQVAYHILHTAARGVEAHSVVIYAASGGVGSAAVELAKLVGMTVIGAVASDEQIPAAIRLGVQQAFNYDSGDFIPGVREATGGQGADLILDSVGGMNFGRNFSIIAPMGLVVSYGYREGWADATKMLAAMRTNFAVSPAVRFFTMHSFDERADIRKQTMQTLLNYFAEGKLDPVVYERLPLAEASRAHDLLESGKVIGKLVMKP